MANSQATKNPFSATKTAMTSSFKNTETAESQCSVTAVLRANHRPKDGNEILITRMQPGIGPPQLQPLPARLGNAGNQSARRQLAKIRPENLKPPEKCTSRPVTWQRLTTRIGLAS